MKKILLISLSIFCLALSFAESKFPFEKQINQMQVDPKIYLLKTTIISFDSFFSELDLSETEKKEGKIAFKQKIEKGEIYKSAGLKFSEEQTGAEANFVYQYGFSSYNWARKVSNLGSYYLFVIMGEKVFEFYFSALDSSKNKNIYDELQKKGYVIYLTQEDAKKEFGLEGSEGYHWTEGNPQKLYSEMKAHENSLPEYALNFQLDWEKLFLEIIDMFKNYEHAAASNLQIYNVPNGKNLITIKQGEKVKILDIGEEETINGILGNWVKVFIPKKTLYQNGKKTKKNIIGWCFSGCL